MQAKPEQRGRQEAESWPCLLGSQHCNRVKSHVVAKPETVGEAQIVGKVTYGCIVHPKHYMLDKLKYYTVA